MTKFTVYYRTNHSNPTKRCTSVERRRTLKARNEQEAISRVMSAIKDSHARGFYALASK